MPSPAPLYDAVIVGAGPNGLAAAIRLAQAGKSTLVLEAAPTPGGGTRSAELTLPGFVHDVCAAIHPLANASPFLRSLPLEQFGLEWVHPALPLAHPLDGDRAVLVARSVDQTAAGLGRDGRTYRRLMNPLVASWPGLMADLLGPLRLPHTWPVTPLFDLAALLPAATFARAALREDATRAMLAGLAAHSMLPLEKLTTNGFALMVGLLAHAVGWPMARRGSQSVADALVAYLQSLRGEVRTGQRVQTLDDLPPARSYLFDLTPRQLLAIAGERLSPAYRRGLERYRYGVGVFKADFALSRPIPWRTPGVECAGTVHLGGSLEEIALSERAVWQGQHPERPFMILAQQSLFDPSRAPAGRHTAWTYCHVPNSSTVDMTSAMMAQIERFAPGFGETVLAVHTYNSVEMERYNPNYIGGDINGGVQDLAQFFTRPMLRRNPYTTSDPALFLCSSSTPPGGGVHGMCGYWAAGAALQRLERDIKRE